MVILQAEMFVQYLVLEMFSCFGAFFQMESSAG